MALRCQNPEYRCTGPSYRLHSRVSAFAHGASIKVLGCQRKEKKKELVQNGAIAIFRLAT